MRRIGVPVTIRITDDVLAQARTESERIHKPLRTLLREIIEQWFKKEGSK